MKEADKQKIWGLRDSVTSFANSDLTRGDLRRDLLRVAKLLKASIDEESEDEFEENQGN